ncbi:type II arginine methyltransferase [Acrasis kona]|uniref:Protein arginine N-methyltransferase n=1 Tax=Acrasis kona TaxID=1008807 RepID=A0AAW2ZAJ3_9EUKA
MPGGQPSEKSANSKQQDNQTTDDPNFDPIVDIVHDVKSKKPNAQIHAGVEPNVFQTVDKALSITDHFDFVVTPISKSESNRKSKHLDMRHMMVKNCIQGTDMLFRTSSWSNVVVGKIDEQAFHILADSDPSNNFEIYQKVQLIFEQELQWASHLSLPAVLLPSPSKQNVVPFAQLLHRAVSKCGYTNIWIRFQPDQWEEWNQVRIICEHSTKISPILELPENLPERDSQTERWFGEPIRGIVLDKNLFQSDYSLSTKHAFLLQRSFKFDIQVILRGTTNVDELFNMRSYLDDLKSQLPPLTEVELFEKPYWDYLQSPLQPLMDNLDSQTYEVFERDPIKYKLYQDAVHRALVDLKNQSSSSSPFTVMVVGAGRGPLVKASIRASVQSKIPIKLYAVDKNPNALVTLYHFKKTIWSKMDVTIIHSDMRDWNPPELADILVSELLGSFGDNELSPECLDGAQRLLKKGGISIPCDYTSFLSPLNSAKIYSEVKTFVTSAKPLKAFETAYVVKVHRGMCLSNIKKVFTFVHPNPELDVKKYDGLDLHLVPDNSRYTVVPFTVMETSTMHGLIGYFECTLYKDVMMSIHPKTFSKGMFSWFPIVFPLATPITVKKGEELNVHFWRNVDKGKVWYEWMVHNKDTGFVTPVHNLNGRSYKLSL